MKKLVLIFLLIIPIFCFSDVEFHITVDSIEYFRFINNSVQDSYNVLVQLNEDYTKRLEQITKKNLNKILTIKLGSTNLVTAMVETKIPSGNFRIHTFSSIEEAKEFMQELLKDQYSSKLYDPSYDNLKPTISYKDSLLIQSSMDFYNFHFQAARTKLSELSNLISPDSDDYTGILTNYIFLNLKANDYNEAQLYLDELNILIESNEISGLDFYSKDGVIPILILVSKNELEEAKKLALQFEEKIDFPKMYEVIRSLHHSSKNNVQYSHEEITKAFNVLGDLPFYSYICYKFGDTEGAITNITEYIDTFSKDSNMKDISFYLLKLMYLCSNESYNKALKLSEQTLTINTTSFKYDTIQSKLWHSVILYNMDRKIEAIDFYIKAKNEFDATDHPKELTLRILLSPHFGIIPGDKVYRDFDIIAGLSNE